MKFPYFTELLTNCKIKITENLLFSWRHGKGDCKLKCQKSVLNLLSTDIALIFCVIKMSHKFFPGTYLGFFLGFLSSSFLKGYLLILKGTWGQNVTPVFMTYFLLILWRKSCSRTVPQVYLSPCRTSMMKMSFHENNWRLVKVVKSS